MIKYDDYHWLLLFLCINEYETNNMEIIFREEPLRALEIFSSFEFRTTNCEPKLGTGQLNINDKTNN